MSDEKQKTLCAHVEEELQVKDPKAYIALIKPATHYCEGCGRSAAKAENVCKPQPLSYIVIPSAPFPAATEMGRFIPPGSLYPPPFQ
jgi:hypothetical protein